MTMTEQVSIANFMAQNPYLFWMLIHIGWGAIYGSITCSLAHIAVRSKQYLEQRPDSKLLVIGIQCLWAVGQLLGVFSVPWLIGSIDKEILIKGTYVPYWLGTWFATVLLFWLMSRKEIDVDARN